MTFLQFFLYFAASKLIMEAVLIGSVLMYRRYQAKKLQAKFQEVIANLEQSLDEEDRKWN